jgi:hypothetical protein
MDGFNDTTRAGERRRVLEMLQRGQISAAEADELMGALEGCSVPEEPPPDPLRPSAGRPASVPGLVAVVASLARTLAMVAGRLSMVLGRVVGAVARLSGRVRDLKRVADRRVRPPQTGL